MKIAVIIPTYYRRDGSSKTKLLKMLGMLGKQTEQDFKIFLIGDYYEKEEEFEEIGKSWKGEISYYNSPIHYRSGYFREAYNKWAVGGTNAVYEGVKRAIEEGYEYYFHLDDDDEWKSNHIENAKKYIEEFPEVDFMITKALYNNEKLLPNESGSIRERKYNNFNIREENSVHSSNIMNLRSLGGYFIGFCERMKEQIERVRRGEIREGHIYPFDCSNLRELRKMQMEGKVKAICILEVTVSKNSDMNFPQ